MRTSTSTSPTPGPTSRSDASLAPQPRRNLPSRGGLPPGLPRDGAPVVLRDVAMGTRSPSTPNVAAPGAEVPASPPPCALICSTPVARQSRCTNLNTVVEGTARMLRRRVGEQVDIVTQLDPQLGAVNVRVVSTPGHCTAFDVYLPRRGALRRRARGPVVRSGAPGGGGFGLPKPSVPRLPRRSFQGAACQKGELRERICGHERQRCLHRY